MGQHVTRLAAKTVAVTLLALAGVACGDSPTALNGAADAEGYRYFNEFITLTPVANRFVVEFDTTIPAEEVATRLGARGFLAAEAVALGAQTGHFEVRVANGGVGTSARERTELLRRARQVPGLRFIAPVYQALDGAEVRPLNVITIQARPGLTNRQVSELFARHGLEQVIRPSWNEGMWHARFRSVVDAYRAANEVYADPSVEWAELDAISGRFLLK